MMKVPNNIKIIYRYIFNWYVVNMYGPIVFNNSFQTSNTTVGIASYYNTMNVRPPLLRLHHASRLPWVEKPINKTLIQQKFQILDEYLWQTCSIVLALFLHVYFLYLKLRLIADHTRL